MLATSLQLWRHSGTALVAGACWQGGAALRISRAGRHQRGRWLRKQSSDPFRFLDALDAEGQGGQAHGDLLLATQGHDLGEGRLQNAEQLIDHFGLSPEEALEVL